MAGLEDNFELEKLAMSSFVIWKVTIVIFFPSMVSKQADLSRCC